MKTPCGNHIIGYSRYLFVSFLKPISIYIFLLIEKILFILVISEAKEELKLIVLLTEDLPSTLNEPPVIIP